MKILKTIFSGVQPSGQLTLGNYLGAIKNWKDIGDEYNSIFCVVDMHALTTRQVPAQLRKNTLEVLAQYIACGLNPEKHTLFIQSHVHQHAQLAWVLNCYTMFGEMSRMTQFKDKSAKNADNINVGLFTYPVLMAADILLYNTDLVPVGSDQKQHIEIARDIAHRFNSVYSDTFTIPEPYIPKISAKIMNLVEPTKKMSKSDENVNSFILLNDQPEDIIRKFKRATTDSDGEIVYKEGKDGINNLMNIYSSITGKSFDVISNEFSGYGDFKLAAGEATAELLRPIREETAYLLKNKDYLENVYKQGADKASYQADKMLMRVYRKIGLK